jgi:hypothetical protein
MTTRLHRSILSGVVLPLAVVLAGCAYTERNELRAERDERANVFPQDYKSDLLAYLRVYLNDPTHVQDAYIAEPAIRNVGFGSRYVVCVRYNAKNLDGRYTGSKEGIAVYAGGRLEQFTSQVKEIKEVCAQADYKPFPELEKLTR